MQLLWESSVQRLLLSVYYCFSGNSLLVSRLRKSDAVRQLPHILSWRTQGQIYVYRYTYNTDRNLDNFHCRLPL